jgi:hypothetical protein
LTATKSHTESADFRRFRRQLFHASLATIFGSLKPGMTIPEIVLCPDGHFRRIIWGLGPYIADYLEQVLLTCIVQGCVHGKASFRIIYFIFLTVVFSYRCRAPSDELDNDQDVYERRSRDHTDFLCTMCEMGVLYNNYGIVGDIIVRICLCLHLIVSDYTHSLSPMNFRVLMCMKLLHPIYSIKSSRERSRII